MIIRDNQKNILTTWMYLERRVNKGSPSGFGGLNEKYNVAERYNPFSAHDNFELFSISNDTSEELGESKNLRNECNIPLAFYLHPETAHFLHSQKSIDVNNTGFFSEPTSSARTVLSNDVFIKLHYDGLIGRVNRSINRKQALSSIELTQVLQRAIDSNILPADFYILREPYAKSIVLSDNYEVSCVFRETSPYPNNKDIRWIIPIFSLFSKDLGQPADEYIIKQIIDISGIDAGRFLVEYLITPIIRNYFMALIKCGLQFEIQAQNCLLALDGDFNIIGTIFRDLESVDKDIQLIKDNDLELYSHSQTPNFFLSYPYKCIWKHYRPGITDPYVIKHSFMFDFKLGIYVIQELVECCTLLYGLKKESINNEIKKITQEYINQLPPDFFPRDCWYYYDNVVLDRKEDSLGRVPPKPFKQQNNPDYR